MHGLFYAMLGLCLAFFHFNYKQFTKRTQKRTLLFDEEFRLLYNIIEYGGYIYDEY